MAAGLALALLALSLAVTLAAARMFAQRLDRLGAAFGLPEALLGLLTALAADGPEISSALVALAKGQHAAGVGVVVGSNVFNLAAMIGLSALLSGAVALRRAALALEGAMALAATLLAAAVLLGWLAPVVGAILLGCLGVPYLLLLARGRDNGHPPPDDVPPQLAAEPTHPRHALWIVSDVALIVAGSFGMVQAALALGGRWGVSDTLVGVLVLAPLTSLPNALTGVRLGLAGRGTALVSETLNSNTINLAGGIMVPALFVTVSSSSTSGHIDLAWLLGMTCICLLGLARSRGAGRSVGGLLVLLYAGFVAVQLL
jgi:cation:H+ antiporter